ncbi:MAG: hypothetical protein QOE08_1698, partial [Thermoleophilaceae bacterium]|nr:hypothetical protein [Thermoleophilaceae bacterium]
GYSSGGYPCYTPTVVQYRSTNPRISDSGEANVTFCDNGSSGDTLSVEVTSGPYAGYSNQGEVHGSVTVK